ncbi:MAG TPA: tripartite tricarboxylate transporter substrate binding protein [Burkholderiales bacterium]|nr:tripartite tricarboxylate transporter substrate binding protein [Burkholderiales bacterium]
MTVAALASPLAHAQSDYPIKPVRLIVPSAPGSGPDTMARAVGQQLSAMLGQPVVVENRSGAGGSIGGEAAAKSPPDGYTLIMASAGSHAVNVGLYPKLPYDPVRDFAPISLVSQAPNILIVHPSLPVKSVKDLVALARSKPGALSFGSGGNGSTAHLSGELFRMLARVNMVHVPFKGAPQSVLAVMAGEVELAFPNLPPAIPQVRTGKLRGVAVTTSKRFGGLPAIPTIAESGVPGYEARAWFGLLAPAGTPRPIVTRLNAEVVKIVKSPDMRTRFLADGAEAIGSTPQEFTAVMKTDIAKWQSVIRASGAKAD